MVPRVCVLGDKSVLHSIPLVGCWEQCNLCGALRHLESATMNYSQINLSSIARQILTHFPSSVWRINH